MFTECRDLLQIPLWASAFHTILPPTESLTNSVDLEVITSVMYQTCKPPPTPPWMNTETSASPQWDIYLEILFLQWFFFFWPSSPAPERLLLAMRTNFTGFHLNGATVSGPGRTQHQETMWRWLVNNAFVFAKQINRRATQSNISQDRLLCRGREGERARERERICLRCMPLLAKSILLKYAIPQTTLSDATQPHTHTPPPTPITEQIDHRELPLDVVSSVYTHRIWSGPLQVWPEVSDGTGAVRPHSADPCHSASLTG